MKLLIKWPFITLFLLTRSLEKTAAQTILQTHHQILFNVDILQGTLPVDVATKRTFETSPSL